MKIVLDDFLTADYLEGATHSNPISAVIKNIVLRSKDDLPFDSKKDRFELSLVINSEEITWLPNKTSLRSLKKKFGGDGVNWVDKEIKLWTIEQVVGSEVKKVVYASA